MFARNFFMLAYTMVFVFACTHVHSAEKIIRTDKYEISIPSIWKPIKITEDNCNAFGYPNDKYHSRALAICVTNKSVKDVLSDTGHFYEENEPVGASRLMRSGAMDVTPAKITIKNNYVAVSSVASCGINSESGMHMGECYIFIAFAKNYSVVFLTDGYGDGEEINKKFDSVRIKRGGNINEILNQIKSSPSFDCAKIANTAEKIICEDEMLSVLDATLDSNYKLLKSANPDDKSEQLLADQRAWIKQRNACKTPECLTKVYSQRIDELCAKYPVASGESPACTLVKDIEFSPQKYGSLSINPQVHNN